MKTLLILRHGKSSWKHLELADHDRPLAKRGVRDAPRMGELIREEGLAPDLILSSTAKRARDTAEMVAKACGYTGEISLTRDLYHAWSDDFIEVLQSLRYNPDCVMVVGHNPGLEELLSMLTDEEEWLPTAALAQVALPIDRWDELDQETEGELVELWRPREL